MSNKKLLTKEDLKLIIPDRQTYGVGFEVTGWSKIKRSLTEHEIRNKRIEIYLNGKQYQVSFDEKFNGVDNKGNKISDPAQIIYYFENTLNGQRLVREYADYKYPENNSNKLLSITGDDNFQPISRRIDPRVKFQLIINHTLSSLIVTHLEDIRGRLVEALNDRWPGQINALNYFTLNSIDLNVDIISDWGCNYGTHSELASRLSLAVISQERGKYFDYNTGRNYCEVFSAVNSDVESGIPCFKATLRDNSEILSYLKSQEQVNGVLYNLNRIEWRITTDFKSSGKQKINNILKTNSHGNRFKNDYNLSKILQSLYFAYREMLTPLFNIQYRMTDADIINMVTYIIEDACPRNSHSLIKALTRPPFRISVSVAKSLGIYKTLGTLCNRNGTGIIYKPEGSHGHDYMFNWPHFKNGAFFLYP